MIYITLGDPLSVNIEILAKLLPQISASGESVLLIGSHWQWRYQTQKLGISVPEMPLLQHTSDLDRQAKGLQFFDLGTEPLDQDPVLLSAKQRGLLATQCLEFLKSITLTPQDAVITAPIDKHACQLAGFAYPGQTEFFESLAGKEGIMLLAGPKLKVGLTTNHLALNDVASQISAALIQEKANTLAKTLRQVYKIKKPRVAVTGLNPHCGDGGMFGLEERDIMVPALKHLDQDQASFTGPIPADTAFFRCFEGEFDAVLAMYHDQGLGPLKTVHFYDAVNITGGLAFLRVSPDHGPAADLYLKGRANAESFESAWHHALRFVT